MTCRSVKGRMSRWTTEEFLSDLKSSSWSVGRRQFKSVRDDLRGPEIFKNHWISTFILEIVGSLMSF